MRFLTTLILLALTVAGAAALGWHAVAPKLGLAPAAGPGKSATAEELAKITPEALTRLEFNDVRLERAGAVWNLPGDWPARTAEVEKVVSIVTGLSSRFAPE